MTRRKEKTQADIVRLFAESASRHHRALLAGDHRKANREAKAMFSAFEELKLMGDEGREALLPLLGSEDEAVVSSAAAVLLRYATDAATTALERVARNKGLLGFRAQQALQRWRKGDWHLDE
ncbi:MAG: DUF2019 domain-containing protein [Chloroflexi bacterium]|nr:DUF2019 domain-containing protein [Chloroflexota bacterium]